MMRLLYISEIFENFFKQTYQFFGNIEIVTEILIKCNEAYMMIAFKKHLNKVVEKKTPTRFESVFY